jgi:hypothetical protein
MRRSPWGQAASSGTRAPSSSNSSSGGSCAARTRAGPGARGWCGLRPGAPGGSARCPRRAGRRRPWGPVQPFGVRSTIIGQRGRVTSPSIPGRGAGWPSISSSTSSSVAAMSWCISAGSSPRRPSDRVAVALKQRGELVVGDAGQHGRVGDLVAVQVQDRQHGAVGAGLRNLFECQLAASGPVSASPSPTTQQTSRSGLSKHAP